MGALIADLAKPKRATTVNIIQHPRGGLKQIAFRRNEVIEIPDGQKDFLYYTTDTEPGSSGSPCFNDQWELIALHHSGVPKRNAQKQVLRTDDQVWRKGTDPDGLIQWIGNEGARVSTIVAAVRAATLKPEWQERRAHMLESTPPNPIELARGNVASPAGSQPDFSFPAAESRPTTPGGGTMGRSYTWTIPVQLTVTVGGSAAIAPTPTPEGARVVEAPQPEDLGPEVTIDQNWANRKGYESNFLGTAIPLPTLSQSMKNNSGKEGACSSAFGQQTAEGRYRYCQDKGERCNRRYVFSSV